MTRDQKCIIRWQERRKLTSSEWCLIIVERYSKRSAVSESWPSSYRASPSAPALASRTPILHRAIQSSSLHLIRIHQARRALSMSPRCKDSWRTSYSRRMWTFRAVRGVLADGGSKRKAGVDVMGVTCVSYKAFEVVPRAQRTGRLVVVKD